MKNNKGFTIAELLVTFVLVMSIVLGLFKIVDHYRERQQNATSIKEINSYKNEIVKVIEDDILFKCDGLKSIEGVDINTKASGTTSNDAQKITLTFNKKDTSNNNNNITKDLIIQKEGIKYGDTFYKFPSKFISAVNDYIYKEEKVTNYKGENTSSATIYSIDINLYHSELNRKFNINIVSVASDDTETTEEGAA